MKKDKKIILKENSIFLLIFMILLFLLTTLALLFFMSKSNLDEYRRIYVVNLNYTERNLSLINIYVKRGYVPGRKIKPERGYLCEVLSFKGEKLYSFKFTPPTKWFYDFIDKKTGELSGGFIEFNNTRFTLIIPYFNNGKSILIYNPNGLKILEIDISKFSEKNKGIPHTFYFLILLSFLIMVIIILIKHKKDKEIYKDYRNKTIENWVKKKLSEGTSPEILKKGLIEEGYDPSLVDAILKKKEK